MARDICRIGTRAAYQSEGRLSFFLSLFFSSSLLLLPLAGHMGYTMTHYMELTVP